jgi:hypothetical protein
MLACYLASQLLLICWPWVLAAALEDDQADAKPKQTHGRKR